LIEVDCQMWLGIKLTMNRWEDRNLDSFVHVVG